MTNNNYPPSRAEINEWISEIKDNNNDKRSTGGWCLSHDEISLLVQKAADRELNACCNVMEDACCTVMKPNGVHVSGTVLRAIRRPKAPTLDELALQFLGTIEKDGRYLPEITDTIRKALTAKGNLPKSS